MVVPVIVGMFREVCRVRAADKEGRGCLVCNCIAELVGVEEELGAVLEQAIMLRTSVVEKLLKQAIEQGEISSDSDPAVMAKSLVTLLLGLSVMSKVVRAEHDLWSVCQMNLLGLGVSGEIVASH